MPGKVYAEDESVFGGVGAPSRVRRHQVNIRAHGRRDENAPLSAVTAIIAIMFLLMSLARC